MAEVLPNANSLTQVESAKDKAYRLSDSNGLYLYILISGVKVWPVRYQFLGKEKIYTLGKVSEITLQKAKEKAFELKKIYLVKLLKNDYSYLMIRYDIK